MQRAEYTARGPVPQDVVECVQRDTPTPKAGEVLLEMLAAPINPSDVLTLTGQYGMLPPLPKPRAVRLWPPKRGLLKRKPWPGPRNPPSTAPVPNRTEPRSTLRRAGLTSARSRTFWKCSFDESLQRRSLRVCVT